MRLLGMLLAIGPLSACAPLPITYYMPSADHGKVQQARCDQAPPYQVLITEPLYRASAALIDDEIDVGLYLPFSESVSSLTARATVL